MEPKDKKPRADRKPVNPGPDKGSIRKEEQVSRPAEKKYRSPEFDKQL